MIIRLVAAIIVVLAAYMLWPQPVETPQQHRRERPAVTVVTTAVERVDYRDPLYTIGTALANESAILSTQTTEKIVGIHFNEGATVAQGDVLLTLEQMEESAAIDAAKVQLEDAKRQYERAKKLSSRNFTSKAALDNAASALATAKQRLATTRASVEDRTIIAPFSGILGTRDVSVGTLLEPGDVITTIDAIDIIKVDIDIAERYLPYVRVGQSFHALTKAYGAKKFSGTIDVVESRVDPVSRTVRLRGLIDNQSAELRPGMLLRVVLEAEPQSILVVPEETIVPIARRHYVFILQDDNTVMRQKVTPDRRFDGMVEIVSGLDEGERVVREGQLKISDGQHVSPQENATEMTTKASE